MTQVVVRQVGPLVTDVRALVVSAPMAVVEWEETRATTKLGASQKDTARELGAKLSSLKGIVWVGVALFVFGVSGVWCRCVRRGDMRTRARLSWRPFFMDLLRVGRA